MLQHFPRLLIAAPESSAGKTTFTLGLMLALRKVGLCVQPFKVGPDFIDPSHHTAICQRASRNLDTWMCEDAAVREIFTRAASGAELSVIEGVMGLFDGYGPHDERGSTAHLAKQLDVPVILVIDAQRTATSAAAIALGFQQFDCDVRLAGIAFNRVGSEGHYAWLKAALETRTGLRSFGYLGFDPQLELQERHLGLVTAAEHAPDSAWSELLLRQFGEHVDVDGLIAAARAASPLNTGATGIFGPSGDQPRVRIGVARDEAFSFYYEDNLDLLKCAGADIIPFSALHDSALPDDLHGLYLGGGFPELHAERFAANSAMKASIRDFHASGGVVYAECGGLMVLCEALVDFAGRRHEMIGLVPAVTVMRREGLTLGYVEVEALKDTLLNAAGTHYRAQTFHYSMLEDVRFDPALKLAHSAKVSYDGYAAANLFATYVHSHFAACPQHARRFVERCRASRR